MKITTTTKYLLAIFLISLILYFPSLKAFYTNDDFFLLKISQANSLKEFLNFFNLTQGPDGLGMYRPLTTQVFYFLGWKVFNLNPLGLHIISFFFFFAVIFLVYKFCLLLLTDHKSPFTNHISLLAAFLYGMSATHFGHLYYLAAFQELGMTFFFLLSTMSFVNFLTKGRNKYLILSILYFLLSLLSKETAVVLPFLLLVIYWYIKTLNRTALSFGKMLVSLAPYFSFLLVYFYFRIAHYGFAQGESYIWDFSIRRAVNTLGWYGLWSFNLPEMLVDFVGPGLHLNPNLFKYWSGQIIPILMLFGVEILLMLYLILKSKILNSKFMTLILFCIAWFLITLLPVLFLPLHKFTFYLTLPLIGIATLIGYFIVNFKPRIINSLFLTTWLIVSILTLNLTRQTNWITRGAQTARNVNTYLTQNAFSLEGVRTIAFYDTEEDSDLPWSPSGVLKVVLSDQNYFKVFWKGQFTASYSNLESDAKGDTKLRARQFLGY